MISLKSTHFWMIMWMKEANNLQIGKVQPQGVRWLLLNFFANFACCYF